MSESSFLIFFFFPRRVKPSGSEVSGRAHDEILDDPITAVIENSESEEEADEAKNVRQRSNQENPFDHAR